MTDKQIDELEKEFLRNFYTEEVIARLMKCPGVAALRCRRTRAKKGEHPPWKKIGNQVLYPRAEFHRWSGIPELKVVS